MITCFSFPIKCKIMDKEIKHNIKGMTVYFLIAVLLGGGFALLALIIHEDNDRCHYYGGKWNKGDLLRGCIAVVAGIVANTLFYNKLLNEILWK